jgi:hypothetical protein
MDGRKIGREAVDRNELAKHGNDISGSIKAGFF